MWKYIKERVFVILLGVHQTDDWEEVQTEGERERKTWKSSQSTLTEYYLHKSKADYCRRQL